MPLVGFYVGWTLHRRGHRPANGARAAWQPLVALAAGWAVAALVGRVAHTGWTANLLLWAIVSLLVAAVVGARVARRGHGAVAYAVAARGVVTAVMAARDRARLGNALRRGAPWLPVDGPPVAVPAPRPAAAGHDLGGLHRGRRARVRGPRPGGRGPAIAVEAPRRTLDSRRTL